MTLAAPRILIIDDLFGRVCDDGRNPERESLCGQFLLRDESEDDASRLSRQKVVAPVARAVFWRGQTPSRSTLGDVVENDLEGIIAKVAEGWNSARADCWAMVLVDLCFYTGGVTTESNAQSRGMPAGCPADDDPRQYFGLRILEALRREFSTLPVAVLSSKSRDEVSREFSTLGALGFLPRDAPDGASALSEFLWWHGLIPDEQQEIAGNSRTLLWALRAARRAARTHRNVLIRGERGSGKDLLSRYIHRQSPGREKSAFVAVNSAVLTAELFASELFGIEKGVATGVDARSGLLRSANGGDVFLDEIKDMIPQVQAGILRALEDRKVATVGGGLPQPIDVRFLAATNSDIESLAGRGTFRGDLLDRLREGGTIYLPPLRDRPEDIELLTEKFVREAEASNPRALRREIDPQAISLLRAHDWPGNIRELRSIVYEAVESYPDVEHLVPVHIRLAQHLPSSDDPRERSIRAGTHGESLADLPLLLRKLRDYRFDPNLVRSYAGIYGEIDASLGGLAARALRAALQATRRPAATFPESAISIQAALRLLTGDETLTAWRAADLVKRIMNNLRTADPELLGDPVLRAALESALHIRPRGKKEGRANQ